MWDLDVVSGVLGRDQGSFECPLEKRATSLALGATTRAGRENVPLVGRGLASWAWLNDSVA